MNYAKAKEILELNIKEAGKSMPPDVLDALKIGIGAIDTCIEIETHSWDISAFKNQRPEAN